MYIRISQLLDHWIHGIRFYIGLTSVLLSLEIWRWAVANHSGSSLLAIRLEEVYAWVSLGFLGLALLVGPLCSVWRTMPGRLLAYDARRLLGVSAAYFATLHVLVAYLSLFSFSNPLNLPGAYRQSFVVGAVAWVILLAMALTSFDAAFRRMGIWWQRLHRLVYVAVVTAVLHAFIIGTQSTLPVTLAIVGVVLVGLLGLHSLAIVKQGRSASRWQLVTIASMTAALVITMSYGYSKRDKYQIKTEGINSVQAY
ncbi:MAG: ferric reductase-like transmembrane domain-containing protein [Candidatus Saccharimonadales bacterium]